MLGKNLADVVETLIEKILFAMMRHPLAQNSAPAAHDPGNPLRDHW